MIIGHSERRAYFGEVEDRINRKIQAALVHGLIPILCVGETLEEYESGQTEAVIGHKLRHDLARMDLGERIGPQGQSPLVIAYEPVWAIGTGRAATSEGANAVIANLIRPMLAGLFGKDLAVATRILYGGSVKPENSAEFFMQEEIDGALVGGASLVATDFIAITRAAVI